MLKPTFYQVLVLCLCVVLLAQNDAFSQSCGTREVNERFLQEHPEYRIQTDALRQQIADRIITQAGQRGSDAITLYTIPVVVHVIHLGEAVGSGSNISATQINDAIAHLNQRFSNAVGNGLEVGIQFCLAVRDPNGNPTTGINRVNGSSVANYTSQGIQWDDSGGASEVDIKLLSIWPREDYYNIWVVHNIFGSVAGYAYFPTTYPIEGAVVEDNYFTNTSTVLTHEMGHAFGLFHTFEGDEDGTTCPTNTDCTLQGDLICDTPPHKQNDCGTTNPCTGTTFPASRFNYMSYCGSTDRFTDNQRTRMLAAMSTSARTTLTTSLGCVASTCSTACADANPCTRDICTNGVCSQQTINCNDGDACTNDICTNFDCFNVQIECTDNDDCTIDLCQDGCIFMPQDCSDGDACTEDICDEGQCISTAVSCDDADACTNDLCVPVGTNIYINYDMSDQQATQAAGGTYTNDQWALNTTFTETSGNSERLQWAATRFNWLRDATTQQEYLYSQNEVKVDSVEIKFIHRNTTGTTDRIVVTIYEDEQGIFIDGQENIANDVLFKDTIVTTTSLSPTASTVVTRRFHPPGLVLAPGQQFIVAVNFYGNTTSTFSIRAGYGNQCFGDCFGYPLFGNDDNAFWKIIYFIGTSNISGVNNLAYDCNGNDIFGEPQSCEAFPIQTYAIGAYVTLNSLVDYECEYTPAACLVNISGAIRTETNVAIPGVSVVLSGDASDTVVTDTSGLYNFTVVKGGNYTITPSKNNDVVTNNGISTLDISLIRRHVLGSNLLNSPYKIIAADASNNNSTSTFDITFVRVVILNNTAKFPGNRLWEFISSSQTFAGPPYNPFETTLIKTRTYTSLNNSVVNQNFIGVKIGDVNSNWNPNTQ